jgi:hypothetical protein
MITREDQVEQLLVRVEKSGRLAERIMWVSVAISLASVALQAFSR